jgi:hypothetical protein
MTIIDVYGEKRRSKVMNDTWGHLRSTPNVKHFGTIIFAAGTFGERIIISLDFGEEAGSRPWFYDQIHEWLWQQETKQGHIYRFKGYFFEDNQSNYTFEGNVKTISTEEDY